MSADRDWRRVARTAHRIELVCWGALTGLFVGALALWIEAIR